MDIKKFLFLIDQVYNNKSNSDDYSQYNLISEPIKTKKNYYFLQLLSIASQCLEDEEVYCEIINDLGFNLITCLQVNVNLMAYGIINSNFNNFEQLSGNLNIFDCENRVSIYEGAIESFCEDLQELNSDDKIGIFHCHGDVSYREMLLGLMNIKEFLAEEAFIIISDVENQGIKDAINDFQKFNNPNQVHQLLVVDSQSKLYPLLEKELVILLWQNNLKNKQIKMVNKRGLEKLNQAQNSRKKKLLHVGCGHYNPNALPEDFNGNDWVEIRLDIDLNVQPDIIGTITDLSSMPDDSVDAVYSSHNLEHIYNFEVPVALKEFRRVLKNGGFVMFIVPDMQTAAEWVIRGEMESPPLYQSSAGAVPALWMFYGMGTSYEGMPYMAHKTGFTTQNLAQKLTEAGFKNLKLIRRDFDIVAYGYNV